MKRLLGLAIILLVGTGLCLAQIEAAPENAPPPGPGQGDQMAPPPPPGPPGIRPDRPSRPGERPARMEERMRERAQAERGDRPPAVERERGPRDERGDQPAPEARERMRERMRGGEMAPDADERGDRPPAMRERMRAQMAEPLSPDEEMRARELVERVRPWEVERLKALARENPRAYQMLLRRGLMEERTLDRLKEADPEAHEARVREFEFEKREHDLAQQFQSAKTDEERAEIEQQLNGVLNQHFDLRTENHRREVRRAEEQLGSLRRQLSEREERKQALVEQMKLRLTGRGEMIEF